MALALLPDGRTMVSGGSGGSVCFWDAAASNRPLNHTQMRLSTELEAMAEADVSAYTPGALDPRVVRRGGFAFTPDSGRFLALDRQGALALWDARSVRVTEDLPSLGSNHWGVALSPDGHWLATGDCAGTVTLWDWATRRCVTNFSLPFEWFGLLRFFRSGHYFVAGAIPNAGSLSVRVWRTADWVEVPLTNSQFAGLWSVDISSDERLMVAGCADGAVKLFRFPSGGLEAKLTGHRGPVHGVHFLPGGSALVSTSTDGSARLWDVGARRELATLPGHAGMIVGGTLSPDGRRLATGGLRPTDAVKVWDLLAHRELLSLPGEGQFFFDLAFSLDGNWLTATSLSGMAHLWRAPSWEEIEAVEKGKRVP
jgi:WD40 repeat protein